MTRYEIINFLINKHFDVNCNYLEIGVCVPDNCFNRIQSNNKAGVDPGISNPENPVEFKMTSDEFFSKLENGETRFAKDHKWDVIFIDGLHTAHQTYVDALNSMNHISENGYVVLHDCSPTAWWTAHSDFEWYYNEKESPSTNNLLKDPMFWELSGTCWKAMYYLRTYLNHKIVTVNTDYGVGVISMNKPNNDIIEHTNTFFDFGEMRKNRKKNLGLISVQEFIDTH